MLDKVTQGTDAGLFLIQSQMDQASGTVLILGNNASAAAVIANNPEVEKVLVVTTDEHFKAAIRSMSLSKDTALKVEQVARNPFGLQRRHIDYVSVDYLFADLWPDAWDLKRIDEISALCREFRPARMGYRWQEIDIAAHWVASGRDLKDITPAAIDAYRIETGLMVGPRTQAYVERCATITTGQMGKR